MKICACNRCGHEWRPHDGRRRPVTCPNCKSRRWDKPRVYKLKAKPDVQPEGFREPPRAERTA